MKTTKDYIVVILPGTNEQTEIAEFSNHEEAIKHTKKHTRDTWIQTDVMRRLQNGTLSTEI